ncbi:MAG: hypothetical protein ABIJ15_05235 [bacterium]
MKKIIIPLSVLAVFILASCDNKNIFGKFHKAGSSSSTAVLLNDANAALEENNPAKAKEIADKILAKEPGNSEALYISAQAGLKQAGFDLGGIITSVIGGSAGGEDADSLLKSFESMDLNNVASAINDAVTNLKKIACGNSDGAIPTDDVDVNLNLGILEVLDAAISLVDFNNNYTIINDTSDVIQIDEDYNIKIQVEGSTYTISDLNDPANSAVLDALKIMKDNNGNTIAEKVTASVEQMESAVNHLIVANEKAGIVETGGKTSTITDLKKSIEDMKLTLNDDFLVKLSTSS